MLNPGQTPVDISDQPAYALTKELQFDHPEMFSQYFPIFKQLHIEQSLFVIHGQLIEGSELVRILTESKFYMKGLSAVINVKQLKESHIDIANYTICTFYQTSILKPIRHHTIGLHKNRKIIHRFCTESVSLIWK